MLAPPDVQPSPAQDALAEEEEAPVRGLLAFRLLTAAGLLALLVTAA